MKCKNCVKAATKALMWCEHRAYIPSCDDCEKTLIEKNPQCWEAADGNKPESIKPIEYVLERKRKMEKRSSITYQSFSDELSKIAASPTAIGAGIGAGVSGLHQGLKEWDHRIKENTELRAGRLSKENVKKTRKDRLKRSATVVALSAGGGAAAGKAGKHLAGKAKEHAKKWTGKAENWAKGVSDYHAANIKKNISDAAKESAEEVGQKLKKGLKPSIFNRTKE